MNLKDHIRGIPDFPKPGILFYDISTLLRHPEAWQETITLLTAAIKQHKPDMLAGIESRGFLVAAPLALSLGCGFLMVRKKGKLPGKVVRHTYTLEYGSDTCEIQADAVIPGQRVVVLSARPTTVQEDLRIDLPDQRDQLRTRSESRFTELRAHVYGEVRRAQRRASVGRGSPGLDDESD